MNNQSETNEINTCKVTAIELALSETKVVLTQPSPTKLSLSSEFCTTTLDGVSYKSKTFFGNNSNKLSVPCLLKLKKLYDIEKVNNKQKFEEEEAYSFLQNIFLVDG